MDFLRKMLGLGPSISEMKRNKDEMGLMRVVETSGNPRRKVEAIIALGEIGSKRSVPTLLRALRDKDADVRRAADFALRQLGYTPSVVQRLGGGISVAYKLVSLLTSIMGLILDAITLVGVISGTPTEVSLEIPLVSFKIGAISITGTTVVADFLGIWLRLEKWDTAGLTAMIMFVAVPLIVKVVGDIYSRLSGGDSISMALILMPLLYFAFFVMWIRAFLVHTFLAAFFIAAIVVLMLVILIILVASGGAGVVAAGLLEFLFTSLPMILIGLFFLALIGYIIYVIASSF